MNSIEIDRLATRKNMICEVSISDSITDVDVEESEPDDISDVSMDECILHPADCSLSSVDSHVGSLHSDSSPRVIFGAVMTSKPKYATKILLPREISSTTHLTHSTISQGDTFINYADESRWTSYQEIQDVDHTKTMLTSYEQAIQHYESGLTTMPRSVSLKDPALTSLPPLLFINSPAFRKRSLSESSSQRRCIFNPPRDRSDSYSSAPPTVQSYQYSKTCLGNNGGSPSIGSRRKLKSCIKNKSDGELSAVNKGRVITPSTSNEKDLSVSFDPHVSIYDFGVPTIKWTQPGWSSFFS